MKPINPTLQLALSYGGILGLSAFALHWMQSQRLANLFPVEIYILVIALAFTILGVWIGNKLAPKTTSNVFIKNEAAISALGLTPRECQILHHLAAGQSNKQIARNLGISPHTIKTHITNLFGKLEASRRTQAVQKARSLRVIP